MKNLVLIKLGGSVITDKRREYFARKERIDVLAREIKKASRKFSGAIIIGHGSGSFAHTPAHIYKTKDGLINKNSLMGMAVTEDAARKLNMILLRNLLETGLPAFSFSPASFLISDTKVYLKSYIDPVKKALQIGLIPVVYGDVVIDKTMGCTIFSTEKILSILANELRKEYKIKIVYVTDVDGVYDDKGKTIPEISNKNIKALKPSIVGASGVDVTGGMIHKVEEALKLANKTGIKTLIINGTKKSLLNNAILGKNMGGTLIS
jgi:isopentenyl phosphate kinase